MRRGYSSVAVTGLASSSFAEAYVLGLKHLLTDGALVPSVADPLSVASNFGKGDRPALELLGYSFRLPASQPTLLISPLRRLNLPYAFGLFFWSIAGSDSVDWLSYYDNRASNFADDNEHLCGAFGKRMFDYRSAIDQVNIVVERIKADPASRRGVSIILTPEDNETPIMDFPCAIACHFFLRNGKLDCVVYMRAQQALTVLPYDQFLFSSIQSLVASKLDVPCGRYIHFAGTFHIYESEIEQADTIVAADVPVVISLGHLSPDARALEDVQALEQRLRKAAHARDIDALQALRATRFVGDSFEENARIVLTAYAFRCAGADPSEVLNERGVSREIRQAIEQYWG